MRALLWIRPTSRDLSGSRSSREAEGRGEEDQDALADLLPVEVPADQEEAVADEGEEGAPASVPGTLARPLRLTVVPMKVAPMALSRNACPNWERRPRRSTTTGCRRSPRRGRRRRRRARAPADRQAGEDRNARLHPDRRRLPAEAVRVRTIVKTMAMRAISHSEIGTPAKAPCRSASRRAAGTRRHIDGLPPSAASCCRLRAR